jgi:exonuclease III
MSTLAQNTISILSWNIHGELRLKLDCPTFHRKYGAHTIISFQETHLRFTEHLLLPKLTTHDCYHTSRPPSQDLKRPGGGLVVLVHKSLRAKILPIHTNSDCLTVHCGSFVLVCSYLPPVSSPWLFHCDVDPVDFLLQVLTTLNLTSDLPIIACGDWNARLTRLVSPTSVDALTNARGQSIYRTLTRLGHSILNTMTARFGPSSDGWTSYQGNGKATVDYVVVNAAALDLVSSFQILPRDEHYSDHAPLLVLFSLPLLSQPSLPHSSYKRKQTTDVTFPMDSEVDRLLASIVESSHDKALQRYHLYGPVHVSTPSIFVYVGAYGGRGRTTCSVFRGFKNDPANRDVPVPGPKKTVVRGYFFAILLALKKSPPDRTVEVFCPSRIVIDSIAWLATRYHGRGWRCADGDILRDIITIIKWRQAPLVLKQCNKFEDGPSQIAHIMARDCPRSDSGSLYFPLDVTSFPPNALSNHDTRSLTLEKVAASTPDPTEQPSKRVKILNSKKPLETHRSRSSIKASKKHNLQKLTDAAKNSGLFWRIFRQLADPGRNTVITVSAAELYPEFRERMNLKLPLPPQFVEARRVLNTILAEHLPDGLLDPDDADLLNAPFSLNDMEESKEHLHTHDGGKALGLDQVSYRQIIEMDNDELRNLANTCVFGEKQDSPSIWLLTAIIGILKAGKNPYDPKSWRTIGLESCFFKWMTLLLLLRVTKWADRKKIIPESQNAFRAGYRTSNNVFILRCMIERAKAEGKTLYVVAVDLTNAFPSTERNTLWLKLHKYGLSGKVFSWLRMVYSRMRYFVRHADEQSPEFESLTGILIGDTMSPELWNLYLADFCPPEIEGCCVLNGIKIRDLEQADDMLLCSTSPIGAQMLVNSFYDWCCANFVEVNVSKTSWTYFGLKPRVLPSLFLAQSSLEYC